MFAISSGVVYTLLHYGALFNSSVVECFIEVVNTNCAVFAAPENSFSLKVTFSLANTLNSVGPLIG